MALFDYFKKQHKVDDGDSGPKVRSLKSSDSYNSLESFNADYLQMREEQECWLEWKYDFSSVEGVKSIPLDCVNAPGANASSSTGTTDMYLRTKGFYYQKQGNGELALECLKRSNEIRFHKLLGYRKDDYYSYVRMLVSYGYVDLARKEKNKIDTFFGDYVDDHHTVTWEYGLQFLSPEERIKRCEELHQMFKNWDNLIEFEIERANKKREYEFVQKMLPNLCPKSQSAYTRAKNTNSKRYQQILAAMDEQGLQFPKPLK